MKIETVRFIIRDFLNQDMGDFINYHQDDRFVTLYSAQTRDLKFLTSLFRKFQHWSDESPRQNFQLAVIQKHSPDILIGCCGIRTEGSEPGWADLGIELNPNYWSKYKYAIEILDALLRFAFTGLGLVGIRGRTIDSNTSIARLAKYYGASYRKIPSADGVRQRGWQEIEWTLSSERWNQSNH